MGSRKRKPLADITNTQNLVPISVLRKLVASSSNSNPISKPRVPILRSNSSFTNQKLCSDSENRSDASVGSSNISASRCSRTVQFRTPPRAISTKGDAGSKDTANRQRQNVDKSSKEIVAGVVLVSPTAVEKRKDKGKAIVVPSDSPESTEINDNQHAKCNSFNVPEKVKQNDKVMLNLFGGPSETAKNSGNIILNPTGCSYEKTKKGNTILSSSGCSTSKTLESGKVFGKYSSCSPEKTIDKEKVILNPPGSSIRRSREIGKNILDSSRFLVERNSEKGKALNPFGSSHGKTRQKGKAILQPSETFEVTKHVSGGVNAPPPKSISEFIKTYGGASSRSALLRTKNKHFDLDKAGNTKSSKSWTDPHPKIRKKRCARVTSPVKLPLDFIQQQKAYFEEIDAFELPEEEVSEDELK